MKLLNRVLLFLGDGVMGVLGAFDVSGGAKIDLPQFPQNLILGRIGLPQCGQTVGAVVVVVGCGVGGVG